MSKFDFFKNKKVIITGHTGFKGSWLALWLDYVGADVVGLSNTVPTEPSNFQVSNLSSRVLDKRFDICNLSLLKKFFIEHQPDFVFHLAAQSLVGESYNNPLKTFLSNSIGTANLLEAIKYLDKKVSVIMITSDKVYENNEWIWGYRENDKIGGKDPYSASKSMAELVIKSYLNSFFHLPENNKYIAIARAGNVIGGGDWANDRIVPDCIRAFSNNDYVYIRNPNSTRPWQHVLEPISGYLNLAFEIHHNSNLHGEAFNFGPPSSQNKSVIELIHEMKNYWSNVKYKDASDQKEFFKEASLLKLNCEKAEKELKWKPTLNFKETVKMTIEWYKNFYSNPNANISLFNIQQLEEYLNLAKNRSINWAS